MKWDAGALSKYRGSSPIFRYLSNDPPYSHTWPKKWRDELGIFLATPGISWLWVEGNFNLTTDRLHTVFKNTVHLHHLGQENVMSATHDDALQYMKHKPTPKIVTPFWVKPFILEDIKSGIKWTPLLEKWNIAHEQLWRIRSDKRGHLFYSLREQGQRKNLGRTSRKSV